MDQVASANIHYLACQRESRQAREQNGMIHEAFEMLPEFLREAPPR
jgi:hypothetical protein